MIPWPPRQCLLQLEHAPRRLQHSLRSAAHVDEFRSGRATLSVRHVAQACAFSAGVAHCGRARTRRSRPPPAPLAPFSSRVSRPARGPRRGAHSPPPSRPSAPAPAAPRGARAGARGAGLDEALGLLVVDGAGRVHEPLHGREPQPLHHHLKGFI